MVVVGVGGGVGGGGYMSVGLCGQEKGESIRVSKQPQVVKFSMFQDDWVKKPWLFPQLGSSVAGTRPIRTTDKEASYHHNALRITVPL